MYQSFYFFHTESPQWLANFSVEFNNWSGLSLESLELNRRLREKIVKKTPSLIEVRNYLFFRQGVLLLKMEKPWEVKMKIFKIKKCILL
jgi:long-subunit fatty acid transport protein